jgi:hypothetical protein
MAHVDGHAALALLTLVVGLLGGLVMCSLRVAFSLVDRSMA